MYHEIQHYFLDQHNTKTQKYCVSNCCVCKLLFQNSYTMLVYCFYENVDVTNIVKQ